LSPTWGGATLSSHPVPPAEAQISSEVPNGRAIASSAPEPRRSAARLLALALATGAGAGLAPVAPGTAGAAVGVLVFLGLAALPAALYAVTVLGVVALGVWAADLAERELARKDDGRIVIDEIAGQLVALFPLVLLGHGASLAGVVTGFVAFRVFDVWKPGPVRAAERAFAGGAGVVLDDVAAGALAAPVVAAVAWIASGSGA
jgi:phosphatidylglycerophosphatase A